VFRTELDRCIAEPGPAACGGAVIAPTGPQFGGDPLVYDDGVLRITRIPGSGLTPGLSARYALAGEIDESTVGLAGKLAEIAADLREVHLDLAALDYSDLAGLRVIVQLAAAGRCRVVLHEVPHHLRAVLGIVPGVDLAS
jgi:ABC-type transporter Mla MlaB component